MRTLRPVVNAADADAKQARVMGPAQRKTLIRIVFQSAETSTSVLDQAHLHLSFKTEEHRVPAL